MRSLKSLMMGVALAVCFATIARAEEQATPREVMKKVIEASEFLAKNKEKGLEQFKDPKGPWVFKDTWVFVMVCEKGTQAANPSNAKLVGADLMAIKDIKGKMFFVEFCKMAKKPEGGWVEYWWPKMNDTKPVRKIGYVRQVQGMPYQVSAGIYDEKVSMDELVKLKP